VKKIRLDQLVLERGLADTRSKARALILAGEILVDGKPAQKAGDLVIGDTRLVRISGPKFVSRGGEKLAGALDHFQIDPTGWVCLDVGASTGGFTDCLLQRGAKRVCTIDVGKGQLDPKIRNDPRVEWKESFHARDLEPKTFETSFGLAVVDASFISLTKILPFVLPCIRPDGILLALIKPQFEASKKEVGKGGVIRDETKRQEIVARIVDYVSEVLKLSDVRTADSVLLGPSGNREVFLTGRVQR
jgi:23S rRNA (cytidine1920-2'-O)/16S rRNA (cytidine1409-2'-O)-methyltransferase